MSVIAFDGRYVVSDTIALRDCCIGKAKKLKRKGNVIYGITGDLKCFDPLIEWFDGGGNKDNFPKFEDDDQFSFLVYINGAWLVYESSCHGLFIEADRFAFGAGNHFAMGAMEAGVNAEEAVEIACKLSPYCDDGNGVIIIDCDKVFRDWHEGVGE